MIEHRCPDCGKVMSSEENIKHFQERERVETIIAAALIQENTVGDIKGLGDEDCIKELNARDYDEIVELYETFLMAAGIVDFDLRETIIGFVRDQNVSCRLKE